MKVMGKLMGYLSTTYPMTIPMELVYVKKYKNVHIEDELWKLWARYMDEQGIGLSERLRRHIRSDIAIYEKKLRSSNMIAAKLLNMGIDPWTEQDPAMIIKIAGGRVLPTGEHRKILNDLELNGYITTIESRKKILVHNPAEAAQIRSELKRSVQ